MMLFSEHNFPHRRGPIGSIEVICGSMFSGKTEELIRRMKRAQFAKLPVEIFKPEIDVRYGLNEVVSHDSNSIPSTPVSHSSAILLVELANRGIRVIVAGLDMDYLGKPFGPIPSLMAIAEDVTKVHAVCVKCGAPANYSYRLQQNESRVLLGEKESYEPRCRACYFGLDRQ